MSDLRALAAKATPGRWANRGCETPGYRCVALSRRRDEPYTIGPVHPKDAAYLAAVSPDVVLALLAAIPDDPRCAGWCYACAAEAPAHRGDCAWVAARSAMGEPR